MFFQIFAVVLLCASAYSQNAVSYTINHDGTSNVGAKIPLFGNDKNVVSALGSKSSTGTFGKGLALDNVNGHGLSLTHTSIPNFGDQLTGAGKVNLVHNTNHNLDANAFITRNMPNIPNANIPNFNTVGGGLDYMYKNKVGASLGVANTPFLQRTDYSALGKLNLFNSPKNSVGASLGVANTPFLQRTDYSALGKLNLFNSPKNSVDLNAGFGRSVSNIPQFNTNWQPQGGLTFTRFW
ncbi:hypothetical protein ACJJTC_001904 [Scirpophaga incertulas]